jgi:hypothetical protein
MSLRSGAFSRERLGRMADVMRGYVDRGEVAGVVTLLCRHDEWSCRIATRSRRP